MKFILEIELNIPKNKRPNWARIQGALKTLSNDLTYFMPTQEIEPDHGAVSAPEGKIIGKWEVVA